MLKDEDLCGHAENDKMEKFFLYREKQSITLHKEVYVGGEKYEFTVDGV